MPQLTCENLTVGYDGKKVREDVSFAVERGDYLCIVGENGSGKTTLMKTLLGLQSPISGKILMGEGLKPTEIGYLPQQTEVQKDFPASVREIVRSGCQSRCGLRPFYIRAEKQMAQEAMCKMRIDDLAGRCYRELSGGQQQRVLLARALCILMISHDVGAGVKAASHVLHIGETTFFGTKAQYLHHIAQEGGDNTHV